MDTRLEATGENTRSKAIDRAGDFYIKTAGDNGAVPTGAFVKLMAKTERQRSVTLEEFAEILDTEELPVKAKLSWSVGSSTM